MNWQSIKNKKAVFNLFVDEHQLDIIIGSESWISPAAHSSELLPANYNFYRKDQEDGYGGVFILCCKRLFSENLPLTTTCEVVVCCIWLFNSSSLVVCSVYRPPSSNCVYMEQLCKALEEIIVKLPKSVIWIAGDINLTNVDWKKFNNVIHGATYPIPCTLLL